MPLRADQDWCLDCGAARPGRLRARGSREASRAAAAIVGAVLVLSGGAVAAGYAALRDSDAPAPVVAAAPAASAAAQPAPTTTPATTSTATTPAPKLPKAKIAALELTPTPTPKPAPDAAKPTKTTTTGDKASPKRSSPSEQPGLQELALGPVAASLYDPYGNAADATDPADSYDDDGATAFTVTETPGRSSMAIGLTFNLETARAVRAVEIHTSTPGFGVEVYGAPAGRPADILSGWRHLGDAADVAVAAADKGAVTVEFTRGRYRHVLLWFTKPPTAGPSVAITEVRLLD